MKFIELFAGIGGFRYGLENKGFTCVWANEIDKYACQIYRKNFGEGELYEGDITTIGERIIPNHDLLVGGFPCQAFSIAGKRGGFEDTRGTMFFEIARIVREKQPRLLLLENVKGLLSHDKGRTFATILSSLDELGYDAEWQVLNSKNFGVPQNRERVFIVGHLRGSSGGQVFPFQRNDGENSKTDGGSSKLLYWKNSKERWVNEERKITPVLKTQNDLCRQTLLDVSYPSRVRKYEETSPTIRNYGSGGNKMPIVIKEKKDGCEKDNNGSSSRCERHTRGVGFGEDDYQASNRCDQEHCEVSSKRIRRLTPIECERLQGFPDDWTKGISDTQRYKCLGNAVTTNVITEIGKRIMEEAWQSK